MIRKDIQKRRQDTGRRWTRKSDRRRRGKCTHLSQRLSLFENVRQVKCGILRWSNGRFIFEDQPQTDRHLWTQRRWSICTWRDVYLWPYPLMRNNRFASRVTPRSQSAQRDTTHWSHQSSQQMIRRIMSLQKQMIYVYHPQSTHTQEAIKRTREVTKRTPIKQITKNLHDIVKVFL